MRNYRVADCPIIGKLLASPPIQISLHRRQAVLQVHLEMGQLARATDFAVGDEIQEDFGVSNHFSFFKAECGTTVGGHVTLHGALRLAGGLLRRAFRKTGYMFSRLYRCCQRYTTSRAICCTQLGPSLQNKALRRSISSCLQSILGVFHLKVAFFQYPRCLNSPLEKALPYCRGILRCALWSFEMPFGYFSMSDCLIEG